MNGTKKKRKIRKKKEASSKGERDKTCGPVGTLTLEGDKEETRFPFS